MFCFCQKVFFCADMGRSFFLLLSFKVSRVRYRGLILLVFFSAMFFLNFSIYKNNDPNKDRLLLELVAYVLERGHYNPKEINDKFSENVFKNYINALDSQHRFFLQSDIDNFSSYK